MNEPKDSLLCDVCRTCMRRKRCPKALTYPQIDKCNAHRTSKKRGQEPPNKKHKETEQNERNKTNKRAV
jgi:hypothetical protein